MHNERTNLLPSYRQDALVHDYFFRLGVVVVALLVTLVLVAAVLLLPSYIFLTESARVKENHLASIKSTLSSAEEVALSARLAALTSDATELASLSKGPFASVILRAALAVSRPGITLSGMTYTPSVGKGGGVLALSGTAATRDALRTYQLALGSASFARSVELPVSAYAKDADISFTITVTLAP